MFKDFVSKRLENLVQFFLKFCQFRLVVFLDLSVKWSLLLHTSVV